MRRIGGVLHQAARMLYPLCCSRRAPYSPPAARSNASPPSTGTGSGGNGGLGSRGSLGSGASSSLCILGPSRAVPNPSASRSSPCIVCAPEAPPERRLRCRSIAPTCRSNDRNSPLLDASAPAHPPGSADAPLPRDAPVEDAPVEVAPAGPNVEGAVSAWDAKPIPRGVWPADAVAPDEGHGIGVMEVPERPGRPSKMLPVSTPDESASTVPGIDWTCDDDAALYAEESPHSAGGGPVSKLTNTRANPALTMRSAPAKSSASTVDA